MGIADDDHPAVSTVFAAAAALTSFIGEGGEREREREGRREATLISDRSGKHLTRSPARRPRCSSSLPPSILPSFLPSAELKFENDCDRERQYQLLDWRTIAAGWKEGGREGGRGNRVSGGR